MKLKQENNENDYKKGKLALEISEHYKFMNMMVTQIRNCGLLLSTIKKEAAKKGLDTIEEELTKSIYHLTVAYGTINQIYTYDKTIKE